jgi:hypothetical protein
MGVSGQQYAPTALYPRETPGTHCTGGWVGPGPVWTAEDLLINVYSTIKLKRGLTSEDNTNANNAITVLKYNPTCNTARHNGGLISP